MTQTLNEVVDFLQKGGFILVDQNPTPEDTTLLNSVLSIAFPIDTTTAKPQVGKYYGVMDRHSQVWNSTYTVKTNSINLSSLRSEIDHYVIIKPFPNVSREMKVGDKVNGAIWEAEAFPEFFKPVYKTKSIVLTLGVNKDVTVEITGSNIVSESRSWELKFFEELLTLYKPSATYHNYDVGVSKIYIGCKEFTLQDIELIVNTATL